MYIYLREAFSPLWGFLYGWTFFTVIQTGTIAAVAVAFARFLASCVLLSPEDNYLIAPVHISSGYAISLSTAQLVAILVIVVLTWTNSRGLEYGKIMQNLFHCRQDRSRWRRCIAAPVSCSAGIPALCESNFSACLRVGAISIRRSGSPTAGIYGLIVALCGGADRLAVLRRFLARHHDHRGRSEGPEAQLAAGAGVRLLDRDDALPARQRRVPVVLPLDGIQNAPSDRVATAMLQQIFPGYGPIIMAVFIMISTFGWVNSLVLAGARHLCDGEGRSVLSAAPGS